jgi:hypothetical protein
MRIFVVGTGRCGTTTFAHAAAYLDNYTVCHESHAGRVGDWSYPDQHIEVSAQLALGIPLLLERYPGARWVHLVRDRQPTVESMVAVSANYLRAFGLYWFHAPDADPAAIAGALHDTVNALCEDLLPDAFRFELDRAAELWPHCWEFMGGPTGFASRLHESAQQWEIRHNARP